MRPLVDKRLRGKLETHWPSRCSIVTVTYTTSASNQLIPSGTTAIASKTNIPCRLSPLIELHPNDNEDRSDTITGEMSERVCKLSVYLPDIQVRAQKAVVDGVTYEIESVDSDSQHFSTRLGLRIIRP